MIINENIKIYWKELMIIFFILASVFFYSRWYTTKKELEANKLIKKSEQTKIDINKPMIEVDNREKEVYPKINESINQLNKSIKILNDAIKKEEKNKPTKEQSYAIFKNQSASQINSYFNSIGINTSIKYCTSK